MTYRVADCDIRRACAAALPRVDDSTNIIRPGDADFRGVAVRIGKRLTRLCSARRDRSGTSHLRLHMQGLRRIDPSVGSPIAGWRPIVHPERRFALPLHNQNWAATLITDRWNPICNSAAVLQPNQKWSRVMTKLVAALLFSVSGIAVAAAHGPGTSSGEWSSEHRFSAPEIDPASAISALTLLVGGVTVLRSRIIKK